MRVELALQEMLPEPQVRWLQSADWMDVGQSPGGQKQPTVSLASSLYCSISPSTKDSERLGSLIFSTEIHVDMSPVDRLPLDVKL